MIKKILAIAMVLCVALAIPVTASAASYFYGDYTINEIDDNNNVEIVLYKGREKSVSVPSKMEQFTVRCIGSFAFTEKPMLTVYIPEGVRSIGSCAFMGCDDLISISLPRSLEKIDSMVLVLCKQDITVYYAGTEEDWQR